jgi:PAS domain S-box-containing protein
MPAAAVMVDREGTIISWNPEAERLFGHREEEVVGAQIDSLLVAPEYREEARACTLSTCSEGRYMRAITKRQRKDGSQADVELRAVPLVVNGEAIGGMAIYHDISELSRARREAEAATEAKSSFLATMSHEIRTPMNAVIGMTTLLLETQLNQEQKMFAETIRSSGESLLAIINDILDFSKIEAGRMELEEQPFELRECVESSLDLVAAQATAKALDLAYIIEPGVPSAIVGDSTRLRQIMLNLLSNAVKFTASGEVVLGLGLAPGSEASGDELDEGDAVRLHFSVRDTGIGIPPERADRLFRSFSQVDTSTTRRFGGTGLGLAISRRLVQLMGGEMWAESEGLPGKGSVFHFTLSARVSRRPIPVYLHRQQPGLSGKRVLIVDDNATNRYILYRQVQSWGMVAEETEFPREALGWLESGGVFDLVLLDMQMPEMDGASLGAAIQALKLQKQPELVMLTSSGMKDVETAGLKLAAYLTKPIKPAILYSTLLDVFGTEFGQPDATEGAATLATPGAAADRESGVAGAGAEAGTFLRQARILLAEDNLVNKQVALLLLKRIGLRADTAGNGLEALESLKRQSYDIVLMDVQMPELDGLEATRRIRAGHRDYGRPYIIAMTANAMQGDREICLSAGMDDYIGKPVRIDELSGALSRAEASIDYAPRNSDAAVAAAAAPRPRASSLDAETLEALRQTVGAENPGALAMLADDFILETEASLTVMKAGGDASAIARAAHSVKSSATLFGATALSALCADLEARLRGPEADVDLPGTVLAIDTEFGRVRKELPEAIGSLS